MIESRMSGSDPSTFTDIERDMEAKGYILTAVFEKPNEIECIKCIQSEVMRLRSIGDTAHLVAVIYLPEFARVWAYPERALLPVPSSVRFSSQPPSQPTLRPEARGHKDRPTIRRIPVSR